MLTGVHSGSDWRGDHPTRVGIRNWACTQLAYAAQLQRIERGYGRHMLTVVVPVSRRVHGALDLGVYEIGKSETHSACG